MEEYLYVDDQRLDRYVEEYGSPVIVQKERKKGIEISLTPKLTFTEEEKIVVPTRSEKIEYLLDNLKKNDLLGNGRFVGRDAFGDSARQFRLETCEAVKTFIPPSSPETMIPSDDELSAGADELLGHNLKEDMQERVRQRKRLVKVQRDAALARARAQIADFKGLNVWISDRHHVGPSNPEKRGQLFLIVGFPKDDYPSGFDAWSAYSAFNGLLRELKYDLAKSVLHSVAQESNSPGSPFERSFLADPLKALRDLDARVGEWRSIKTLYRVRNVILYEEPNDERESIATIAYPVFIAASGF